MLVCRASLNHAGTNAKREDVASRICLMILCGWSLELRRALGKLRAHIMALAHEVILDTLSQAALPNSIRPAC